MRHLAAGGTSPGRLVETDSDFNIIAEHPKDVAGTANIFQDLFNPHGLSVDFDKNIILTSDFIVPLSILKPSLGKISDNTLRLWNLASRTIISTITIPNVGQVLFLASLSSTIMISGTDISKHQGRRNTRRQIYSGQQRVSCSRHRCAPGTSLDHLSLQDRSQWQAGRCRALLRSWSQSARSGRDLVCLPSSFSM